VKTNTTGVPYPAISNYYTTPTANSSKFSSYPVKASHPKQAFDVTDDISIYKKELRAAKKRKEEEDARRAADEQRKQAKFEQLQYEEYQEQQRDDAERKAQEVDAYEMPIDEYKKELRAAQKRQEKINRINNITPEQRQQERFASLNQVVYEEQLWQDEQQKTARKQEREEAKRARDTTKFEELNGTAFPKTKPSPYSEAEIKQFRKNRELANKENRNSLAANLDFGKLQESQRQAWAEYAKEQFSENYAKARLADRSIKTYLDKNGDVMQDGWSLLNSGSAYLPQFGNHLKAGLGGAALGGGAAAIAGAALHIPEEVITVPLGAKIGYTAAVTKHSYDMMRGDAFRNLLDNGIEAEMALKLAHDEALINALIEAGDTVLDLSTLGVGKVFDVLGKEGIKKGAKALAKNGAQEGAEKALKNIATIMVKYALNVAGEGVQEGLQEAVQIGSEKRAGLTDRNAIDDWMRMWEAAKGGMQIATLFGGADVAGQISLFSPQVQTLAQKYLDLKNSKKKSILENGTTAPTTDSNLFTTKELDQLTPEQLADPVINQKARDSLVTTKEVQPTKEAYGSRTVNEDSLLSQELQNDIYTDVMAETVPMHIKNAVDVTDTNVSAIDFENQQLQNVGLQGTVTLPNSDLFTAQELDSLTAEQLSDPVINQNARASLVALSKTKQEQETSAYQEVGERDRLSPELRRELDESLVADKVTDKAHTESDASEVIDKTFGSEGGSASTISPEMEYLTRILNYILVLEAENMQSTSWKSVAKEREL